jgi:hypothetical protein
VDNFRGGNVKDNIEKIQAVREYHTLRSQIKSRFRARENVPDELIESLRENIKLLESLKDPMYSNLVDWDRFEHASGLWSSIPRKGLPYGWQRMARDFELGIMLGPRRTTQERFIRESIHSDGILGIPEFFKQYCIPDPSVAVPVPPQNPPLCCEVPADRRDAYGIIDGKISLGNYPDDFPSYEPEGTFSNRIIADQTNQQVYLFAGFQYLLPLQKGFNSLTMNTVAEHGSLFGSWFGGPHSEFSMWEGLIIQIPTFDGFNDWVSKVKLRYNINIYTRHVEYGPDSYDTTPYNFEFYLDNQWDLPVFQFVKYMLHLKDADIADLCHTGMEAYFWPIEWSLTRSNVVVY